MKILKRVLIILLSTFLLAEGAIRLAGFLSQRDRKLEFSNEDFRIVFLGNSHTWGAGVETTQTYSSVLSEFFKSKAPEAKVTVIESGILNGTTKGLNQRMDELLPKVHPQLVVVMGGEPNVWNREGFPDYLATVEGKTGEDNFWLKARLFLSHSRFIKWMISLKEIPLTAELSPELQDQLAVYQFLSDFDVSPGVDLIDRKGSGIRDTLRKFISLHEKESLPELRRAVFTLGLIEIRKLQNYSEGFSLLEKAIVEGADGAYELQEIIQEMEEKDFPKEQLPELRRLKKLSKLSKFSERLNESANSHTLENDPKLMEYVVKNFPYNSRLMFGVVQNLSGKPEWIMPLYDLLLSSNPLQNQFASIYDEVEEVSRTSQNPKVRAMAQAIKDKFARRFPTEMLRFNPDIKKDIENWISWDLGNLIKKIRNNGSEVVLQTYHYHGFRPHLQTDTMLQSAITRASVTEKAYLLETHKTFLKEQAAYPEETERFFVDNWLHPSVTGHRIIARIIYDYLNEKKLLPPELLNLDSKAIYQFSWE